VRVLCPADTVGHCVCDGCDGTVWAYLVVCVVVVVGGGGVVWVASASRL
jgi:hypothetical protein